MVSKAAAKETSSASIGYAISKHEAELLDKNLVNGDKAKDIKAEFETFQDLNGRCKNNSISIVISPAREDGTKLTKDELRDISKEYMQRMGLDKHQYVVGLHNDTKTPHLHIIANRINHRGEAYKDGRIGRKSWNITNQMAQERGLVIANEVSEKSKNLEQTLNQKENLRLQREEIRRIFAQSVKKKPRDFNQYKKLMEENAKKMKKSLEVVPYINKQGKFQGYSIKYEGNKFKASDISRNMSLPKLMNEQRPMKNLLSSSKILANSNPPLAVTDKLIKAVKVVAKTISKGGISHGI